jgi:uncharacterized protein YuzE
MEGPMMPGHITLSVDTSVGAAYIQFTDKPVAQTIEETPDIQVDIDATETVVGVEVLSLTAELPTEPLLLSRYHFAAPDHALALSQVGRTLQAHLYSAVAGQACVPNPTLQAV